MTFLQAGQHQVGFEDQDKDIQLERMEAPFVFISESPVMKKVHDKIKKLAFLSSPVLILGASGTGKNSVACEIFNKDKDSHSKRFIKCVCYGLSPEVIKKKLFGDNGEQGLLSCGANSTLFIKGLELWPPVLQSKVLFYLSANKERENRPRLICSAGEKFSDMVKDSSFSAELFEVLSQNFLVLPSLSERLEDIPFFISLFNKQNDFKGYITHSALKVLENYSWPGNITEFKNACLQMSILYAGKEFIDEKDLSLIIQKDQPIEKIIKYNPKLSLEDLINSYIQMSLDHFQSKKRSAKALGISVKTIYNKIKTGRVVFSD